MPCSQLHDLMSDASSDYGSDFTPDEEELINELLAKAVAEHAATAPLPPPPQPETPELSTLGTTGPAVKDIEDCHEENSPSSWTSRVLGQQKSIWQVSRTRQGAVASFPDPISGDGGAALVEHPNSSEGRERQREKDVAREKEWTADATAIDTRSPLERFRKPPNKAFSVTDLISPAWCELQYWYTLTKHGRKKRTPAMKQGSTIHKTLEDEIYTTVSVEITTKEDAMALRIWNVIQGLRTLREYGITRELEVWGLVDGELVNGVIDQLSYECPDLELEAEAASFYAAGEASRTALPEYQMSLSDYLLSPAQGGKRLSDLSWHDEDPLASDDTFSASGSQPGPESYSIPRVYLTDVKTRASNSVPTVKSTSFRPTLLQLQMYYHMLNRLVTTDDVSIELLASRYNLDPERTFTDAFITEVGGLNDQFFDALSSTEFDPDYVPSTEDAATKHTPSGDADMSSTPSRSQDSTSALLAHNNLTTLWSLMKDQLRLTFIPQSPPSAISCAPSIPSDSQPRMLESYPTTVSPLLTAQYLSSEPTAEPRPRVLGSRSFLFDPPTLTSYLSDQMGWWCGARDPRGVEVMEAWKCRICEFREECTWRQEREWAYARRKRRRGSPSLADV